MEQRLSELQVPGVRTVIARLGLVIGADCADAPDAAVVTCLPGKHSGRRQAAYQLDIAPRYVARTELSAKQHGTAWRVQYCYAAARYSLRQFGKGIARSVSRPVLLRIPAPLLRVLLGELASNFLTSADVVPARLQMADFHWELPDFAEAMQAVAQGTRFRTAIRRGSAQQQRYALVARV